MSQPALIVIDVQEGFADPIWGRRNNPACETNIAALVALWRDRGWPLVYVRHDSANPDSPLAAGTAGNALRPLLAAEPDVLITKQVNSAFLGTPDLRAWLHERSLDEVVICGVTTNHCCETTARMAGNLGFDTTFILDATHTFDRAAPDGTTITADELMRVTAANLHGEFATVTDTQTVLANPRAGSGDAR
jgi:nicotinamidase-related amidase